MDRDVAIGDRAKDDDSSRNTKYYMTSDNSKSSRVILMRSTTLWRQIGMRLARVMIVMKIQSLNVMIVLIVMRIMFLLSTHLELLLVLLNSFDKKLSFMSRTW